MIEEYSRLVQDLLNFPVQVNVEHLVDCVALLEDERNLWK